MHAIRITTPSLPLIVVIFAHRPGLNADIPLDKLFVIQLASKTQSRLRFCPAYNRSILYNPGNSLESAASPIRSDVSMFQCRSQLSLYQLMHHRGSCFAPYWCKLYPNMP